MDNTNDIQVTFPWIVDKLRLLEKSMVIVPPPENKDDGVDEHEMGWTVIDGGTVIAHATDAESADLFRAAAFLAPLLVEHLEKMAKTNHGKPRS